MSARSKADARWARQGRRTSVPGVCVGCGCTDDFGCELGCEWIDADRVVCSVCYKIFDRVRAYFAREQAKNKRRRTMAAKRDRR